MRGCDRRASVCHERQGDGRLAAAVSRSQELASDASKARLKELHDEALKNASVPKIPVPQPAHVATDSCAAERYQ